MIAFAFTVVSPARADVYFFGLQDIPIPINDATGVFINITQAGTVASNAAWDVNLTLGGGVVYNGTNFQPVRTSGGNSDMTDRILALAAGDLIDGSLLYGTGFGASDGHTGSGAGYFNSGMPAYMGFRYMGSEYGWMEATLNPNSSAGTVMSWAYETNGSSMTAGNVQQTLNMAGTARP